MLVFVEQGSMGRGHQGPRFHVMSARVRKDRLVMAKWELSLAKGKELENTERKREERAVEIVFPTTAKIIGTISEGSVRDGYLLTSYK